MGGRGAGAAALHGIRGGRGREGGREREAAECDRVRGRWCWPAEEGGGPERRMGARREEDWEAVRLGVWVASWRLEGEGKVRGRGGIGARWVLPGG